MAFGPGPRPKMRTQLLTPLALQSKKSCEKVYLTTAMESINVGLKDADAEACIGDPFASPEGGGKNIEDVIAGILWAFVFLLTVGCAGYGLLILFENTLLPKGSGERRRHKGKAPGEVVQIGTRWYDEWIEDNMPDLTGKVCVFTGGDSGIGYWAVNALAGANCLVVLASRYMKEGKKAKQQILAAHPDAKIEVFKMENMDLSSVRAFAKAFLAKHDQLDFLIDNAGVMAKPLIQSKDGHDIQFQTNHLAHFLLTKLLWERLVSSTGQSRVVIQSSVTHRLGSLVFDRNRMEHPTYDWGWFGLNVLIKHVALPAMGFLEIDHWSRYGVSKLCNVLMMRELQRKIEKKALTDKVLSLACHPGWASTPLHRGAAHAMKDWRKMSALYGQSAADGSLPLLMAVVSSDVQNGDFLGPTGRGELEGPPGIVKVGGNGNNEKMAKSLWEYSEECIGEPFEI